MKMRMSLCMNKALSFRIWVVCILCMSTFCVYAQSDDQLISLGEVKVKSAQVVNKPDGKLIYPSEVQKSSSNSSYSLLQKLGLSNIRVDDVGKSVSVIDQRGSVQLRINGILADKADMLSLDPKSIVKIDFIDNPGVRYGDGVAYVINILTRRVASGYSCGTELTPLLTLMNGNGYVYGRWNIGKNELALSYIVDYRDLYGGRQEEQADYHLSDGSVHTITRNDVASRICSVDHNTKLTYSYADSTRLIFQTSLSGDFNCEPDNYNRKIITEAASSYVAEQKTSNKMHSPVLDIYYFQQFTPRQSFTFNTVGTYIGTRSSNSYDEGFPYQYDVDGKTVSSQTEAIYENKLKPFVLQTGLHYGQKFVHNTYNGDVISRSVMHHHRLYAFSEIKGSWSRLRYQIGAGISWLYYRQDEHQYRYSTFCPKLALTYHINDLWQLSYQFQSNERVSQIAMISDAMIRTNSMEWTRGNPDLKPNREFENTLRLAYTDVRLQAYLLGYHKSCIRPNMALYERTADDQFVYTQQNQRQINILNTMAYVSYWFVPDKLATTVQGGLFRCFNFGNNYTHCYTAYYTTADLQAYWKSFSFRAYADNGWRFLEGESRGYNGFDVALKATYAYKDWQFSLTWRLPFMKNYKIYETEVLNQNLHKLIAYRMIDAGNQVSLNITWRLSRGRKYQTVDRSINLKDSDTGIIH